MSQPQSNSLINRNGIFVVLLLVATTASAESRRPDQGAKRRRSGTERNEDNAHLSPPSRNVAALGPAYVTAQPTNPPRGPFRFNETFKDFDATRFRTEIPNKNTEVRDGVLWTRGDSVGKYPPMVYLDVDGKNLEISFRYRHIENDGMVWFFVDGDDGFGSVDHMLRVKLNRTAVQLQVDAHSLDPAHPDRQNTGRPADKVSGAYRLNKRFPQEDVDLTSNVWRAVKLSFRGESVTISVDGKAWTRTLKHACFDETKRKLLWMQKGGKKGIEIDDIKVTESATPDPVYRETGSRKRQVDPPIQECLDCRPRWEERAKRRACE